MKCAEQDNLLNTPISQTLGAILRWMNDDNDDYDDNDHSDNDDNLIKIHQYLKTFIFLPDPGVSGVRSMGPGVSIYVTPTLL